MDIYFMIKSTILDDYWKDGISFLDDALSVDYII